MMRVSSSSSPRMASWRCRGDALDKLSGSRGARGEETERQTGRVRKPSPKRFFPVAKAASTRTVTSGNRRRGARATRGRGRGRSGGRTLRSLDALPASSRTSAVRYSARTGARVGVRTRAAGSPKQRLDPRGNAGEGCGNPGPETRGEVRSRRAAGMRTEDGGGVDGGGGADAPPGGGAVLRCGTSDRGARARQTEESTNGRRPVTVPN